GSFDYVQKPEWHWLHQHKFAQEAIHSSPPFKECVPIVAAEAAVNDGEAEFRLSQFVGTLISRTQNTLSDEDLVELLSTFIADLHGAPTNIDVSVWIDGLWLGSPSITVMGIQLRRPEPKDFEYERSFDQQLTRFYRSVVPALSIGGRVVPGSER